MEDIQLLELLKEKSIKHIAIIMDGNGRWASNRGLERTEGHKIGAERVIEIVKLASDLGVKVISLYAFSTENWKRPQSEVQTLFDLLAKFANRELGNFIKNNAKLHVMGDISKLPLITRKAIQKSIDVTKSNDGVVVNIGINYGSRDEIRNAIVKVLDLYDNGEISKDDIDEQTISNYLYTSELPDPDLLIRTGGEQRLSNFMLYQLAYSEFLFTDVLWPDFTADELKKCMVSFLNRNRRFGGLNEKKSDK